MSLPERMRCRISVKRSGTAGRDGMSTFVVECDPHDNLLEVLTRLQREHDPTLTFRCSCLIGKCNVCLMKVNGEMVYACKKRIEEEMVVEAADNHPVLRDLVVAFGERKDRGE